MYVVSSRNDIITVVGEMGCKDKVCSLYNMLLTLFTKWISRQNTRLLIEIATKKLWINASRLKSPIARNLTYKKEKGALHK